MNPWENDPEAVTATQPWEADPEAVAGPWENDPPTDAAELETFRRDNRLADASTIAIQDPRALTPGLQLAQEPLPALQPPGIQTPPANINAADAAGMVADLYRLERDAQQAEGAGIQPANEAANMQRRNLQMAGLAPEDINRRLEDFKALDFSASTRGMPRARTLSDGRLVVDPALAFDPAAWNAAVDGSSASDVEKENAKYYRTQLRDELAQQIVSPLRSASPEFAAALEKGRATRSVGELVEDFKRTNSGTFSNLWDQFGIALSQGKAQLGKSLMGAARMATFDMLPGNLGEGFADDANWHAKRRAALGGGQWAGDLTATVVGTLPSVAVGAGTSSFPAMLATAGGQTAGDTFVSARQAGWSPLEAAGAAIVQGGIDSGITAAFGKTGIESVAAGATEKGLVRRVITEGAAEIPEEVSITALQAPMNEAIQPGSSADLPQQLLDTAWQSFAIGGGVAALNGKPSEKPAQPAAPTDTTAPAPAQEAPNFDDLAADLKAIANEDSDEPTGTAPLPKEPTIWKPAPEAPPLPPAPVAPDENFARATSFPRGLLPFVTPEEAGAVMAEKEGQMQLVAVQALMNRARTRQAEAATTAQPPATPDAPLPPAPAGPAPIGPDVQAKIAADPEVQTDVTTESASPQPATPFAERQQDPVAEGALHVRETELLRRLESKRRETRENAEAELMARKGLPWTNRPEQAQITARETAELRARVQEREARWNNEADQLAEEAGIEITADNIPFSQQKINPEPIAQAVRETMEMLGVGPDVVTAEVVDDVESIEDINARRAATASKKAGNNIRAYYLAGKAGKPSRVVINAAGVRTPEAARIATLHEVAGHHGLRVLFTKAQGKWRGIVDRLYRRLSNGELSQDVQRETGVRTLRELQELYHRPDAGMNYDPATEEGRSNLIEEVLATMAPFAKKPAWYQSILSELKTLLNRVTGGLLGRSFTDADVNVLLAKARRAAKRGDGKAKGVKMSQAPVATAGIVATAERSARNALSEWEKTLPDSVPQWSEGSDNTANEDWNLNLRFGGLNEIVKAFKPVFDALDGTLEWQSARTGSQYISGTIVNERDDSGEIVDSSRFKITMRDHPVSQSRSAEFGANTKVIRVDSMESVRDVVKGTYRVLDGLLEVIAPYQRWLNENATGATEAAPALASDTEYLDAVKRGDMATAQRMVDGAAKAAGYNVGPVWHGTRRQFNEFIPSQPRGAIGNKPGIYFSPDKRTAEEYAMDADGATDSKSRVIPAYIRNAETNTSRLYGTTEYRVDSAADVKSADPVTYDDAGNVIPLSQRFNEASPDIRFSQESAEREARSVQRALEASAKGGVKMSQAPGAKASDAEYLDAVKRGDMATAQRMVDEAAKAAGFSVKGFHGTDEKFTEFRLDAKIRRDSGEKGKGFYFATDKQFASMHGEITKGFWVKLQNPFPFNQGSEQIRLILKVAGPRPSEGLTKGVSEAGSWSQKVRDGLLALGYDGAVDTNETTPEGIQKFASEFVVFDPNQIKSADPVTYDDAGNVIPLSQRFNEASNDIRFSQESAEREARSVQRALEASAEDLKEYATQKKAKADPNVPDAVKQMLNGVYATYSDAQALRDAQAWLDKDGADEVERTLMGGQRAQLDGRDVAAAKLIASRLSTLGLHQRYTDFMRAVFTKMNTQAQGLQKMHLLFDTTTPEGALAYFQKEVENAISQLSDKNKEQARIIQGLLGMLEQFKADAATSRIVMALRTIATSAELTEARKSEVSEKMRAALVNDDGTDTTRVRLRGLFIAAGVEVKAADKMAVQLLTKFRAAQKKARAQVIKQLLKVPKIVKRIPKGMFAKWEKLNDEGALSDAKLFGAIANKFGFPVFTSEDAATIRGFFDRYKAATEPELKFVQAAKLLEWIEERTNPAGIMEKAGTLYKLVKLASFKVIERNLLGNLSFAVARTAGIDVPMWIGEKGISLFTGKRVAPLSTALGNMFRGQAEVNRIYRIGRDYAVSQGEGKAKSARAGFDTLLTAARYHMAGYRDATALKNIHRSVFSSAAGKMFEKVMHAVITLPDLGRFYGEVNAEIARLMVAAGPGTVLPTAEMFEAAYLHAQRELYQGKNKLTDAVETIVKGANKLTGSEKFGIGTVIATFVRVPVNILKEGATWSPLGVVRALYNAGIDKDPRRAVQSAMKAVVGTGALIPAGAWLYGLGIITAALDEDDEIAAVQRASGMQKYAINLSMLNRRRLSGNWLTKEEAQEGDVIVSYAWAQPMAFSLAAGAEMQRRHDKAATTDEPWWSRRIVEPAGSGFGAFMEQPLVTGVSAFSNDLMQARQTGNYRTLWRLPIRALDFVPAIVRDVRYFNNNALPETRSSDVIGGEFSRILGGVPGIDLPQRYNVLGEAEERYQAASNTILNTFFNPAMTTFVRKHPVASEVLRLAEQTGDKSVAPARVNKSVRINTTGMPNAAQTLALTNQDVSRLQELQGKLFVELAKLEMTRPDYFRMTDYQRAKSMADAVAASQSAAKSVLFGHRLYSISPEGATLNRDAVRAVLIGKAAGIIP